MQQGGGKFGRDSFSNQSEYIGITFLVSALGLAGFEQLLLVEAY
jgi:hypothetical protein